MPILPVQVTVVVPTKNEAHNIVPFLQSLPDDVSLVVVDASEDETPNLVAQHRSWHAQVIRSPAKIAGARQIGAAAARTEWLLFTDADMVFAEHYFQRLQECTADCDAVYGSKHSLDEYAQYYRWFSRGQGLMHWLGIPAASGSNLLIRREISPSMKIPKWCGGSKSGATASVLHQSWLSMSAITAACIKERCARPCTLLSAACFSFSICCPIAGAVRIGGTGPSIRRIERVAWGDPVVPVLHCPTVSST